MPWYLYLAELAPQVKVGLAKPVQVTLLPRDRVLLDGKAEVRLGHIPGRTTVPPEEVFSATSRTVSWILKKDSGKASVKITAVSEKGGRDEKLPELKWAGAHRAQPNPTRKPESGSCGIISSKSR